MSTNSAFAQQLTRQIGRRFIPQRRVLSSATPSNPRDLSRFQVGERVLINGERLTSPLTPGESTPVPRNSKNAKLNHDDVIGQPAGLLRVPNGTDHRYLTIQRPTLDQSVARYPRNVTPIYAPYASHIVSLLDIHPPTPTRPPNTDQDGGRHDTERLEILEAGTGHGALTISLARAIVAGNYPPPLSALPGGRNREDTTEYDADWRAWFKSRQTVVHTVENVARNSRDAEKHIRGFRNGLYWPHVDFHIGGVEEWLQQQLEERPEGAKEFLSYVLLDMPAPELALNLAAQAMKEGALLAMFCPSITQIAECQKLKKQQGLPLVLEKVVELGEGISTGRIWDVRVVVPRKQQRKGADRSNGDIDLGATDSAQETAFESVSSSEEDPGVAEAAIEDVKFVCRPKVGLMTVGGGFVGLFSKRSPIRDA